MKRICLLGAAVAAVLILGVASAMAASSHASNGGTKSKTPSTVTTKVSCAASLILQVAPGATDVTPAAQDGTQMGPVACNTGKGVEWESFSTEDSGDITGKWQAWFNAGSVYGTFTLTPDDTSPPTTTTSFSQASYTGTFAVKNGTGAYAKATATGTLKCSTKDAVHFSCKQAGKVTLPAPATTKKG
ncbi:MAG TPA: hypothetical protein VGH67_17870 [Solirubrobacteraceae bacterium]